MFVGDELGATNSETEGDVRLHLSCAPSPRPC